ncbi:hypothetical protein G4Y79_13560 [Phototrophicus methaneseepsis]|uniref:Uncharacterized protein n=1 Tax=Phototrophicus methaneseepsis TaxID=2710758 RepID=A0A7S8E5H6_9CHLR|nr:hypothetical protein [Phototrophicus methaneseepsis]QPC80739.1 hypothetical protein G4Y79_13560 [Phototrophicus methaneseepsis]
MIGFPWARNFEIADDDLDYLTNLLLEQEKPMTSTELALALVERRLDEERNSLQAQYQDTTPYQPADNYKVGQRLVFTAMDYATATVTDVRPGDNPQHDDFNVITVEFDDAKLNTGNQPREFAANFTGEHTLSEQPATAMADELSDVTAMDIIKETRGSIVRQVHLALIDHQALTRVGGYWFPKDLVIEFDIGTLHLAEAVLDMAGGGPLETDEIITQIGGLGAGTETLQSFSLNLAMSRDDRFDEVGPTGEILWFLNRMEPEGVREVPTWLRYRDIPYNEDLITDEMIVLETELDDELTEIEFDGNIRRATTTLIYPHRRAGTLPLNAKNSQIFPSGRSPRIHMQLIDGIDGTEYNGWVVHEHRYVYGLLDYYTKHRLPIGAIVQIERGEKDGQYVISHEAYKPRTEYIRLFVPSETQIAFETKKRAIGAEYDELMVIGVDDLAALDKLVAAQKDKTMAALLRNLIAELGKLSPQNTVHAVTLYSALNVLRRCPPGAVFALLQANPDFEYVGNHYWKLSES